jgi:hypothetical protein
VWGSDYTIIPFVIRIRVIGDQTRGGSGPIFVIPLHHRIGFGDPLPGIGVSILHDRITLTWLRMEMRSGPYHVRVHTVLAHHVTKLGKQTLAFVGSHPVHAHGAWFGHVPNSRSDILLGKM